MIKVVISDEIKYSDLIKWLNENIGYGLNVGQISIYDDINVIFKKSTATWYYEYGVFWFKNKNDALLFKLTYGGR